MSEAELHVLQARLLGGQLNKARRGELWMSAPIGFLWDRAKRLVLDPDVQIQASVRLLFETFRRTGSATQVVRHFAREGLLWPRRLRSGPRAGDVVWGTLEHSRVLQILHNPRYAGAFVYGRTRQRTVALGGQAGYRRVPRAQWKVFLPNAHPGYLSWEEYEANQATLLANAAGYNAERGRSPAREGMALLQGIAICGRCGGRMTVRYALRRGHPVPDYLCQRRGIERAQSPCQVILGTGLDEAITDIVLEALTPAALDVALEVFNELRARKAEVDRLRRAQMERAREEAELAQRQFMLVRPEHRLVADSLERTWNEKLAELAQAEEDYRRATQEDKPEPSVEERERIYALVTDLPRMWHDPHTSMRERKRMLRLLIEDVTLLRSHVLQIQIRWKGGATTSLERPLPLSAPDLKRTPAAIVETIRGLAAHKTDRQIAETLNARSLRSGTGQPFTRLRVRTVREAYGIPSLAQHLRDAGWLTPAEIAPILRVHYTTAKRFAREGVLRALRADDKGSLLFEPPRDALPRAHPGKRFRDRRQCPQCASHVSQELQYEA